MRPVNQPPVPPLPPAPDAAGHLALPLLRQYVAGTLPAATQHRIEAHTLSCTRCAEILEGLQVSDPATTDAALLQLQARLHQRLAQAEAPRRARHLWRAAAAVLLLLLVSTAVWWNVRRPQAGPASAPVAMQTIPAPPAESPAAPTPPAAAAEATPAAPESGAAVAMATPAKASANYRRAPATARPQLNRRAAANTEVAAAETADEAKSATVAAVAADEAPVAMTMRVAAPAVAAKAAVAAADTGDAVTAPQARSTQQVAEESVTRKAALPPAPAFSPQPVGGYTKLREYLRREGLFVPEPPDRQLSGSVRVQFTVTAAGKLENFRILRGIRADYDAEAIRLLCEGPAWQPGTANGRRADQVVEITISF